jgi:hypothetical protein
MRSAREAGSRASALAFCLIVLLRRVEGRSAPSSGGESSLNSETSETHPNPAGAGLLPPSELRYSVLRNQLTSTFFLSPITLLLPPGVEGRLAAVLEDPPVSPSKSRSSSCTGDPEPGGGAMPVDEQRVSWADGRAASELSSQACQTHQSCFPSRKIRRRTSLERSCLAREAYRALHRQSWAALAPRRAG